MWLAERGFDRVQRWSRLYGRRGMTQHQCVLPDADAEHVTGFDTGPGNMVVDAIARLSGHRYDVDGGGARRGHVIGPALQEALSHPFFARPAPKSTGREEFGAEFTARLIERVRAEGGSLEFTEWAAREEDMNVLLMRSRYRQPFGTFTGTLPGGIALAEGPMIELKDLSPTFRQGEPDDFDLRVSKLEDVVAAAERRKIEETLRDLAGDKEAAAERLGLSATTLWRKMKRLQIRWPGN